MEKLQYGESSFKADSIKKKNSAKESLSAEIRSFSWINWSKSLGRELQSLLERHFASESDLDPSSGGASVARSPSNRKSPFLRIARIETMKN